MRDGSWWRRFWLPWYNSDTLFDDFKHAKKVRMENGQREEWWEDTTLSDKKAGYDAGWWAGYNAGYTEAWEETAEKELPLLKVAKTAARHGGKIRPLR